MDDRFDRIDARFDRLDAEIRDLRLEMQAGFGGVRGEIADLRREMHHFMIAVFGMFAAQTAAMVAIAVQL